MHEKPRRAALEYSRLNTNLKNLIVAVITSTASLPEGDTLTNSEVSSDSVSHFSEHKPADMNGTSSAVAICATWAQISGHTMPIKALVFCVSFVTIWINYIKSTTIIIGRRPNERAVRLEIQVSIAQLVCMYTVCRYTYKQVVQWILTQRQCSAVSIFAKNFYHLRAMMGTIAKKLILLCLTFNSVQRYLKEFNRRIGNEKIKTER